MTGSKRRVFCAAMAAVLLLGILSGCRTASPEVQAADENLPILVVGCDIYPPYNYTGADGRSAGIDVDLAREALRRMGYQAEFVYIDWENKNELLERGEIDCIWSSFSMDGREDEYRWAGPYMTSRQVVAVMPDSGIASLQDLQGCTVAVQATTKPEEIFLGGGAGRVPKVKTIFSMQDRELIYPALSKGYVDAVAAHETSIRQYMEDYDVEYRILDEPLMTVGLGVAFAKSDTRGLETELTAVFAAMRSDGTMAQIIGNYLPEPEKYLEVDSNEN